MDQLLKRGRKKRSLNGKWTEAEIQRLRRLCSANTLFMKEIAEKLDKPPGTVRWRAHKLGIWSKPPGRHAEWNRKHSHLREAVMTYFLKHSFKDTAKHFGLELREMKSLMTYGYKDEKLKHLRKEWRPHSSWTADDLLFMVKTAGIQPRAWIAKKLKRGTTYNPVKDTLAKFGGRAKYMNGMPISWAKEIFDTEDLELEVIQTKAGPTGDGGKNSTFLYRIVPWVTCERLIRQGRTRILVGQGCWGGDRRRVAPRLKPDEETRRAISAMAVFQRWTHDTSSEKKIVEFIKQTLRRR